MADAVTSQTLAETASHVVMKFTNISDGTGEAAVTKVDVSALTTPPGEVVIERIAFSTSGMAVRILWDATADVVAWLVPADQSGDLSFMDSDGIGGTGITNNAGAGKTGDIQFTTIGHTSGDTYSIVLYMRKRFT